MQSIEEFMQISSRNLCAAIACALFQMPIQANAGPIAQPLRVVDTNGKIVGQLGSAGGPAAAYLTIGGLDTALLLSGQSSISGRSPFLSYYYESVYFASTDCSGVSYIYGYVTGRLASAMVRSGGRDLLFVSNALETKDISYSSYLHPGTGVCVLGSAGPVGLFPVLQGPIDLTDKFLPPFRIR